MSDGTGGLSVWVQWNGREAAPRLAEKLVEAAKTGAVFTLNVDGESFTEFLVTHLTESSSWDSREVRTEMVFVPVGAVSP